MSFQKILVGIDNSPLSEVVFERSLELADLSHARLKLFHCITADVIAVDPNLPGQIAVSPQFVNPVYETEYNSLLHQQTVQAQEQLSAYCHRAYQRGVPAEFDCRITVPGQGLCDIAQDWRADLIIVGRRGRRGLTEMLLGSVSNYVVHHAPCAVLVIQPERI